MTTAMRSIERAMRTAPPMAAVAAADLRRLVDRGSLRRVRRGAYLYFPGDRADEIFFLLEGRVEISSVSPSGHRGLHTSLDPPRFVGELGVLAGVHRTSALAVHDCELWVADAEEFVAFVGERSDVAIAFLRALARQVHEHETLVDDLLFLDLKGRVAKRLLGLVAPRFDELPANGAVVPAFVTHADLAGLAGGSRENVSRILSDLQRRGIVAREGRRLVLKDVTALRRLAQI